MIPIVKNGIYTIDIEVKPLPQYEKKHQNTVNKDDEESEVHVEGANFYPWTSEIYGISVCWGYEYEQTDYFTGDNIRKVVTFLSENRLKLGAHNVFYDWCHLFYAFELPLNFIMDSGVVSQCINNSDSIMSFGLKQTTQRMYSIETQDIEIKEYLKLLKIPASKYGAFIHLCPTEMIEKYCRLDSLYCWRLIYDSKKWLKSDISQYMQLYMSEVQLTIIQFIEGILIDREGFKKEKIHIETKIKEIEHNFISHPELIPFIDQVQIKKFEVAQKKFKKKILNYEEWSVKNKFNINSTRQLKDLFDAQGLFYDAQKNKFNYPYTNFISGTKINNPNSPKLGTKFLYLYGTGGEILEDKGEKVTLVSHINRTLEESELTGRLHAHINLLGTKSGRISGSGANIVATPISNSSYGKYLIVEPDWILFSVDFKALEPTIFACLSNDSVLKYATYEGEGKKPFLKDNILYIDDIYISAAYSAPFMRPQIEEILDFDKWVEESDIIKKKLKSIRSLSKTIVLATNYGAASKKIQQTIRENLKETIPIKNIVIFQESYWSTIFEADQYKRRLELEAKEKGYLINIGGYPLTFYNRIGGPIEGTHKALNRMIQSSAAVVMKLFLHFFYNKIKNDFNIRPQVCDWHDAFHGKCKKDYIDKTKQYIAESLLEVNETLQLPLKFRLDFNCGQNFYEAKG